MHQWIKKLALLVSDREELRRLKVAHWFQVFILQFLKPVQQTPLSLTYFGDWVGWGRWIGDQWYDTNPKVMFTVVYAYKSIFLKSFSKYLHNKTENFFTQFTGMFRHSLGALYCSLLELKALFVLLTWNYWLLLVLRYLDNWLLYVTTFYYTKQLQRHIPSFRHS